MERLIADAAKLDDSVDANSMSFGNIVKAIHAVQVEMGIYGTTAREAGTTISGSIGMMKAAWSNLITGIANKNANLEQLFDNLVTSIVGDGTETNLGVFGNILPAIKTALNGASKLVQGLLPKIVQEIPSIINDNLPVLAEAAISIIKSLVDGISKNQGMLKTTAFKTIIYLAKSLISMLPKIVELGLDLVVSLAEGIVENIDELLPAVLEAIMAIGEALIKHAPELINAGIELASAVIGGILKQFGDFAPLIAGVVAAFAAYNAVVNAGKIVTTAMTIASKAAAAAQWLVNAALSANPIGIVVALIAGLVAAIVTLWNTNDGFRNALISAWKAIKSAATNIFSAIANFFTTTIPNAFNSVIDWFKNVGEKFADIGKNIVDGLKNGIENAWKNLKEWFTGLFDDIIGVAKKILGIASPSKVFKKLGSWTAEGFGVGFEDAFGDVEKDIEKSLDFGDYSIGVDSYSGRSIGSHAGATSFGTVNININGYEVQDDEALARKIAYKLQKMTERKGAVYA